jgi:hypothetical protein
MFEIGTSLREARERQGLDFAQLESATKIRGKYLRALEEEQFDQLPAQTYVKGFLRTYADILGLDGQLYVDEFNSRYGVEVDEPPIRTRAVHGQRRVQTGAVVGALVGIAVVTALVIVAWTAGSPDEQKLPGVETNTATRERAKTPPPNAPASITLRAVRAPVFLLVRKNSPKGKVLFNESLDAGETEHFTVRRLWVNTGTPENLRVLIGGKRQRLPGGRPQVFYVTRRGISSA